VDEVDRQALRSRPPCQGGVGGVFPAPPAPQEVSQPTPPKELGVLGALAVQSSPCPPPTLDELRTLLRRARRNRGSTATTRAWHAGFLNLPRLDRAAFVHARFSVAELEEEILEEILATWTWDPPARRQIPPPVRQRGKLEAFDRDNRHFTELLGEAEPWERQQWKDEACPDVDDPLEGPERYDPIQGRDPYRREDQSSDSRQHLATAPWCAEGGESAEDGDRTSVPSASDEEPAGPTQKPDAEREPAEAVAAPAMANLPRHAGTGTVEPAAQIGRASCRERVLAMV
jgi:hypothetical protein